MSNSFEYLTSADIDMTATFTFKKVKELNPDVPEADLVRKVRGKIVEFDDINRWFKIEKETGGYNTVYVHNVMNIEDVQPSNGDTK